MFLNGKRCETHRMLFCEWWLCLCKSIEQSTVPTRLCKSVLVRQWAELWLYPVCLMLHAGFSSGGHMQEKQNVLFLPLLECLLITSH